MRTQEKKGKNSASGQHIDGSFPVYKALSWFLKAVCNVTPLQRRQLTFRGLFAFPSWAFPSVAVIRAGREDTPSSRLSWRFPPGRQHPVPCPTQVPPP